MNILIKQAFIVDPTSPFNGQTTDIFIEDGKITSMDNKNSSHAQQVIDIPGLHVSPGWMDVFANFADPGYEFKETLGTGAMAAAAGGYTDVMVVPNTNPVLHNKAYIEYIIQNSKALPIHIHPIGAITKNTEGKELAEMYDMQSSGAIAFSDGIHSIQSAGLLVKALQYVKAFEGIVIQLPDDKTINPQGQMNEGVVSTRLGLPGKPAMAEELVIARDIKLARYASSKIHFTGVSTGKSLEYIRRGKENASITCSVTPNHLFFSDEDLSDYDSNLKLNPPLRSKEDRMLLVKGILDGTIDCIATHHFPHEADSKVVEFEYAKEGTIGLETAYAVVNTAMAGISQERMVEIFCINPRKIFDLPIPTIDKDAQASLSLFLPGQEWVVGAKDFHSRSLNTPYLGATLRGKVIGIINKGQVFLNT
jgi:dihydroorotase